MPFIEVDVEPGLNTDWAVVKIFESKNESQEITRVVAGLPSGGIGLCQVVGWSSNGPCPAYAVLVGDSGEGTVLLVHGGDAGIRLKDGDSVDPWDVNDSSQWGEPCLLLPADAYAE